MVNAIPADFEQEEKKNNKEQDREQDGLLPVPNIEGHTTVGVPETCPLWEQTKDFYTRNFPTDDVSYRVRMPVLSLVVTLVAMHYFITTVGHGMGWNGPNSHILYFAYLVLAAGIAFELWWGLNTNNNKHINVWILLKTFEILATIFAFIYYIYDQNRHSKNLILFYYVPVMGLNSWIFYSVLQSTKGLRNQRINTVENSIYTISVR